MKPGWQTTEFWLMAAAVLVGLVMSSGAIANDAVLQGLGLLVSLVGGGTYTVGRSGIKRQEQTARAAMALGAPENEAPKE